MTEICSLSLTQAAQALQKKELSAVDAVTACLARMDATEPRIAAMLTVDKEGALAAAAAQVVWHWTLIRDRTRDGCFKAFRQNHWVGFAVFAGVVLGLA